MSCLQAPTSAVGPAPAACAGRIASPDAQRRPVRCEGRPSRSDLSPNPCPHPPARTYVCTDTERRDKGVERVPRRSAVPCRLPIVRLAVVGRCPDRSRSRDGLVLLGLDLALLSLEQLLGLELRADELITRLADRANETVQLQLRR